MSKYIFSRNHEILEGVPTLECSQVHFATKDNLLLVDVRQEEEYVGELGHIPGAILKTLGPDLETFLMTEAEKEQEIVFICRSGKRSATATSIARSLGFKHSYNMAGGMIDWNNQEYPVE